MEPPLGVDGVPVAVPILLYCPAAAVPLAVNTQVSPASSRPS